jgi:aminopeptidase N
MFACFAEDGLSLSRSFLIQAQLEMIISANGLSENVYEIASKSLAA